VGTMCNTVSRFHFFMVFPTGSVIWQNNRFTPKRSALLESVSILRCASVETEDRFSQFTHTFLFQDKDAMRRTFSNNAQSEAPISPFSSTRLYSFICWTVAAVTIVLIFYGRPT